MNNFKIAQVVSESTEPYSLLILVPVHLHSHLLYPLARFPPILIYYAPSFTIELCS